MISKKELTQGNIFKQIILLAIPIIGSSFVQMAYNLTDIFWIGSIGSKYVTGVGTVGYLLWFSVALVFMLKVGAEVLISQSVGSKSNNKIVAIAQNTIFLTVSFALSLMLLLFFIGKQLLNLFKFADTDIYLIAENYLNVSLFGFVFLMLSLVFSGIYNGLGDSKTPFYVNSIGLILNIVLDPLLIYGWGFIPELKANGAALASVFAQMVVCLIFIFLLRHKKREILSFIGFKENISREYIAKLIKTGLPVSIHACLFSIFAFMIAQLVSKWGAEPVAILSIGANIEAVSWMTAGGFSTALSTFTGQNYGAGNFKRIKSAFYITSLVSVVLDCLQPLHFYFCPSKLLNYSTKNL
ncbi:MAG: MATE family efflux transporter [Bacteroidales bacterium]|nr:MATE family efflux transporter [Bacteroidales bacterium]